MVAAGLLLPVVAFLCSLLSYSLADFSRSILEDICEERDRLDRFTSIMRNYRRAWLLCHCGFIGCLLLMVLLFVGSDAFAQFLPPQSLNSLSVLLWILRCAGALVTAGFVLAILPWTVARVRGERILAASWPLLSVLITLTAPVWKGADAVDKLVHRIAGLPDPDTSAAHSILEDELRTVVDEGRRVGVLEPNASRMIHRVVDLQTEDVAAIMTPRTEMVTIAASTPLDEALDMVVEQSYSRIPITGQSIDDIVGVLYARDLLAELRASESHVASRNVGDIAREVLFIPESQRIELLLEDMQQRKVHLAIVVDEYSGVAGLVTMEDILEEIVGEIADEHDDEEGPLCAVRDDGSIVADGRIHLDELNREFGFAFPEDEEYDTIGGFVMAELARIPAVGESVHWNGTTIEVTDADERQLKQVHLVRTTAASGNSQTE